MGGRNGRREVGLKKVECRIGGRWEVNSKKWRELGGWPPKKSGIWHVGYFWLTFDNMCL